MSNGFGSRLKKLRLEKDLTQEKLGNLLGVSDKAVSKWETDGGLPDVTFLPNIAKVFNTSIDFLLTGDDERRPISDLERCAKRNSVEILNELLEKRVSLVDENKKTLVDYTFEYEAYDVFIELFNNHRLTRKLTFLYSDRTQFFQNKLKVLLEGNFVNAIRLSLIGNSTELLDKLEIKKVKFQSPFNTNMDLEKTLFFETLKHPNVKEETISYLLEPSKEGHLWIDGWLALIEYYLNGKNSDKLIRILEKALKLNLETKAKIDQLESSRDKSYPSHAPYMFESKDFCFVTSNTGHRRVIGFVVIIPEEIIKKALDLRLFDLVTKMNEINKHSLNSHAYVASEFEFDSRKIKDEQHLSAKDKKIKLITHGGIVRINELIELDDYDIYQKYIKLPASNIEQLMNYVEEDNFRFIMDYALKNEITDIIREIHNFDKERLKNLLRTYYYSSFRFDERHAGKILKSNELNFKYYEHVKYKANLKNLNNSFDSLVLIKETILFELVIGHKDKRFFEHAIKTDSNNLDWALENVEPSRFDIIKLLLDAGAKVHKRFRADNGWGDIESYDEIDEIGTEILKKKINDIIGG